MELLQAINRFYYDYSLAELRLMQGDDLYRHVSYNSYLYLDLIAGHENCTPSTLAGLLGVSRPAVTAKINELVRLGLVEKRQSEQDRRVTHLALSAAVREDYARYDARLEKAARALQAQYSPEAVALFIQMLEDLRKERLKDEPNP